MRIATGVALLIVAGCFYSGNALAEERTQYAIETILCRIDSEIGRGELEHKENTSQRERIESKLGNPVGLVFEDIHVSKIMEFVTNTYDLNVMMDNRVIAPEKNKTRVSTEADLILRNPDDAEYITDGVISFINLKDVSLRDALTAILRPLNLAYRVEDNFIWISSPQKLKEESFNDFRAELEREHVLVRTKGTLIFFGDREIRLGRSDVERAVARMTQFEGFSVMSRPRLTTLNDKLCWISTMKKESFEYLTPVHVEDEGTYFVRSTQEEEIGVVVEMTIRNKSENELFFDSSVRASFVTGRESIPESALEVGKPRVVKVQREVKDVVVQPNRWFATLMNAPDDSILLMLTRIRKLDAGGTRYFVSSSRRISASPHVSFEGKWLRVAGKLNMDSLKHAIPFDAEGTSGGKAYLIALPGESSPDLNNQLSVLGDVDSMVLDSAPRMTFPINWQQSRQRNRNDSPRIAYQVLMMDGPDSFTVEYAADPPDPAYSGKIQNVLRHINSPDREPIIKAAELDRHALVIDPFWAEESSDASDDEALRPDLAVKGRLRLGGAAFAVRVDDGVTPDEYSVDLTLHYRHILFAPPPDNAAEVQAAMDFRIKKDQPYAIVFPVNEENFIIFAFTASPAADTPRYFQE